MAKIEMTKYICRNCRFSFRKKSDRACFECPKCKGEAYWSESAIFTGSPALHRYPDITAFGYDKKTGRQVAVTAKGKRIDPSETRYNLKRDPHGWKVAGQKIRDYDRLGRKNR